MIDYDEVGLIPDILATYDDAGNVISPAIHKSGWHVNSTSFVPEWNDYLIDPQPISPFRIYAGGNSFFAYKFDSRDQFKTVLALTDETI